MSIRVALIAAAGLALALYLVIAVGAQPVLSAAVAVGWVGFAILCLPVLGLFLLLGAAWSVLLPEPSFAQLRVTIWARMVRDAASEVLPFSQLGGIVLGARAAILRGVPQRLIVASMIVDGTCEMLAQVIYIVLGVIILGAYAPRALYVGSLAGDLAFGTGLLAIGVGLVLTLQYFGREIAQKVGFRLFPQAAAATTAVADLLQSIYGKPRRVGLSALIHLGAWMASAMGTWLVFRLMAVRIDLAAVMSIESLVTVARSAAFVVPNAIGVQEAAYALLVPLFGVGAEFGLAASLLKRARDIAVGVPILLVWQGFEGRRALESARAGKQAAAMVNVADENDFS